MTWGQLELIHVILDFGDGTANIATWHIGHQKSIKGLHIVLLYNGSTHFTGTSNILYWGTLSTLCTALKHIYQTLLNSLKPYQTFLPIEHYIIQTLLNTLELS